MSFYLWNNSYWFSENIITILFYFKRNLKQNDIYDIKVLRVISPFIVIIVIRRIQVNRIFSWIDNDFYRIAIKRVIDSKWNFNQNLLIVWTTCKWSDGEWWLLLDKFFTWLVWWSPFYWFEFTLKASFSRLSNQL